MEAKELMIGDKVMVKVLSQIPGTYVLHTWTANDYSRDLQVKPIPLTPKILEKNGFWVMKKVDNGAEESIAYAIDGLIFHYNRDNDYYFPNTPISWKYVHELQHALRLCGLEELADNFKVYEE